MRSSTSAFDPLVLGLAAVFAAIPPAVGFAVLPPAREGTAVPVAQREPELTVHQDAELIILGNSKAGSDIDGPTLLAATGRNDLRAQVIHLGSATLPIYFAVIKNVILTHAHPRTIVVYATGIEVLTADLTADRRERLLRPYLTADEPVIARKLYDHAPNGPAGLRERAVAARDGTLSWLADNAAAAVAGAPGRAHLDTAFTTVFGNSWAARTRPDLTGVPMGGYPSESALGQTLEDSFVLEVEEVCRANGVKFVVALAPVTGNVRERETRRLHGLEPVLAQASRAVDGWIDLPYPGDDPSLWRDDEHMALTAAKRTTTVLGTELVRQGLLP